MAGRTCPPRTSPPWAGRCSPTTCCAVELAGTLLLVATIGAIAIAQPQPATGKEDLR